MREGMFIVAALVGIFCVLFAVSMVWLFAGDVALLLAVAAVLALMAVIGR